MWEWWDKAAVLSMESVLFAGKQYLQVAFKVVHFGYAGMLE